MKLLPSRWRLIVGCLVVLSILSLYEDAMYYVHVRSFYKDFLYFHILRFAFADHSAERFGIKKTKTKKFKFFFCFFLCC